MSKSGTGEQVVTVTVSSLKAHPALANFPMLPDEQFAALKASILQHGPLKPLTVVRGKAEGGSLKAEGREDVGHLYVIDGRNRLRAHRELGTPHVACIVAPDDTDPVGYAVESAVTGRNLTKSGIVLLLFLTHPEIITERAERKGGRPRSETVHSVNGFQEPDSYKALAERYGVPYQYFSTLAQVYSKCRDADQWEAVKQAILGDEISIPRIHAGIGSAVSDHTKQRQDPQYQQLLFKLPGTITNAFRNWGRLPWDEQFPREGALGQIREMVTAMPDEVRAVTADAVVESWPKHDQEALFKALLGKLRGKGRG